MQVNFEAILTDLKGEPLKKVDQPITLAEVCTEALLATTQADQNLSGDEKFKRFELALKCNGVSDLKVEDVAKLKQRIGEVWAPLVIGRAWQILDGDATPLT